MNPDWARSLRDQCKAAGVPFFFKQWGEWAPTGNVNSANGAVSAATGRLVIPLTELGLATVTREDNGPWQRMYRVGKKAAGRLLDGEIHEAFPEVPHE